METEAEFCYHTPDGRRVYFFYDFEERNAFQKIFGGEVSGKYLTL